MNVNQTKASITTMLAFFICASAQANGPQFVQNNGQWPASVKHYVRVGNADIFFENDGLKLNVYNTELFSHKHEHSHTHAEVGNDAFGYAVQFVGSAGNVDVTGAGLLPHYRNYFLGNDPTKWAGKVPIYSSLHYKNLYQGIDLIYREDKGKLKYDVVVMPGGDASKFRMKYDGVKAIRIADNGNLEVTNPFNTITETAPIAYQEIGGKRVAVPCQFKLEGNEVYFHFPMGYDGEIELTIDPTLIFSSYSGSFADNFGFTATYDNNGNLYGGGIVFGANYPFVAGSYSSTFSGGIDMGISKFSPNGSALIYSTYIGGSGGETPNSMVVNSQGQLVVFGPSSSTNFPTTAGAYDQTFNGGVTVNYPSNGASFNGGTDIVVAVLSADGSQLVGCTFLGGSGNDGLNITTQLQYNYGDQFRGEVVVDDQDNIFLVSSTASIDFPATAGAIDNLIGGTQDAVVARFNPDLTALTWATYLGGSDSDAGYSIKLNPVNNRLYVVGGTRSNDMPLGPGGLNATFQGGQADGFLVRMNINGTIIQGGTYLGTSAYDQAYFVEIDFDGDVYVYGQSVGSYPVSAGVYSNANSKQFIHKLSPSLTTTLFSTVFGSGSSGVNISPTAFLVDQCKRIYVSGWGGTTNSSGNPAVSNTNNMPVTVDAQQSTTDGSDFYFAAFSEGATTLLYATYFGGANLAEHVDGGTSRFNPQGQIYQAVCAGCGGSDNFPTTPGAWSNANNASNCNLGVIKFDFDIEEVEVDITPTTPFEGCAPFQIQFDATSVLAETVEWNFGDGSPVSNDLLPTHTYLTPGTYSVTLVGTNASLCTGQVFRDSSVVTITVYPPAIANAGPDLEGCINQPLALNASGGVSYLWSPTTGLSNPSIANPTATIDAPTTYTVTVTDANGCEATDEMNIDIFTITAGPDTSLCPGQSIQVFVGGSGTTYQWSPTLGVSNPTIPNPTITMGDSLVYTVSVTSVSGCVAQAQVQLGSVAAPIAAFEAQFVPTCQGVRATFSNQSLNGGSYRWWLGDGTVTDTIAPIHTYPLGYGPLVSLVVTDPTGQCTDTVTVDYRSSWLGTDSLTVLYGNVLTPNEDGFNDCFAPGFVGDLYDCYRLKVYNRWGLKLFDYPDISDKECWDGRTKGGTLLEDGTYYYIVKVADEERTGWVLLKSH